MLEPALQADTLLHQRPLQAEPRQVLKIARVQQHRTCVNTHTHTPPSALFAPLRVFVNLVNLNIQAQGDAKEKLIRL